MITALLKTHPLTTLDCLVDLRGDRKIDADMFEAGVARASPIETVDPETLVAWAQVAPARRFLRLGVAMPIFKVENFDEVTGLSPSFLSVLAHAPDKAGFLGDSYTRVHPNGWFGSLAASLEHRKAILGRLSELGYADVDRWLDNTNTAVDRWIALAREREGQEEESFE